MKFKKIVLAGGSGCIGRKLIRYYQDKAAEVIVLSRKQHPAAGNIKTVLWDGRTSGDWKNALEGADMVINLCGKSVNCRYTPKSRAEIVRSRVEPTLILAGAIDSLTTRPKVWINLASATIYRHAQDKAQDEETGDIGYGFSIDVCRQWEDAFFNTTAAGVRKIALRTSIVMSKQGGALPVLLRVTNAGLGGKQGHGRQIVSWIHEHDLARITEWIYDHDELSGVVNATGPKPLANADMMKIIRRASGIPFGLPAPQWLLAIAAPVIGTEPELILKSRWVYPKKLIESGFKFHYADFDSAVNDLLAIHQ